jgi:hypothetical protein
MKLFDTPVVQILCSTLIRRKRDKKMPPLPLIEAMNNRNEITPPQQRCMKAGMLMGKNVSCFLIMLRG